MSGNNFTPVRDFNGQPANVSSGVEKDSIAVAASCQNPSDPAYAKPVVVPQASFSYEANDVLEPRITANVRCLSGNLQANVLHTNAQGKPVRSEILTGVSDVTLICPTLSSLSVTHVPSGEANLSCQVPPPPSKPRLR